MGGEYSCQNVNRIVNRFLIFPYRIVSYLIISCIIRYIKNLIKFIKNYKYTYIKGICGANESGNHDPFHIKPKAHVEEEEMSEDE